MAQGGQYHCRSTRAADCRIFARHNCRIIAAANRRYFADPPGSSCYWERLSGFGGTLTEILANDFVGYAALQIVVDIRADDRGFNSTSCGNWYTSGRQAFQTDIHPGVWVVGDQLTPGTYQANVGAGCYWERKRNFLGDLNSIIANDFIASAGSHLVSISANDVGFLTDGDCGTWTRTLAVTTTKQRAAQSLASIAANRERHRQQR
jgi:hypothetical protein